MRLFLIGFMGAGKTTVGKILARRLGYRFVDLDDRIENRVQMPVHAIFARWGEARFRSLEHEQLRAAASEDKVVVATGGGVLGTDANRALLASDGHVAVWLNPDFNIIANRMHDADQPKRPLWTSEKAAHALFDARAEDYRGAADVTVAIDAEDAPETVATTIERELRAWGVGEQTCAT